MSTLSHRDQYGVPTKPEGSLCDDKTPSLSKDTLDALEELGNVLKQIDKRILLEGYQIMNGVVQEKDSNAHE